MADAASRIALSVTPHSGRDEVLGLIAGQNGPEVKVRVTAPPEKGKANAAVCKLLAKAIGVPKSAVKVVSGETSHHKVVQVDAPHQTVAAWLSSLSAIVQ